MRKSFINIIKNAIEQNKVQTKLNALIGQKKKSDYIKISLPKKYIAMIEVLAMYGIENDVQLVSYLENNKLIKP